MNKEIEIAITNEEDLYDKYNKNYINDDLIQYIIKKAVELKSVSNYKIIITSTLKNDIDYEELIKEGLRKEYIKSYDKHNINTRFFFFYLISGITLLIISRILNSTVIFSEIFLIGGWVLIWKVIELLLFTNFEENLKRKLLKRLLNSLIIENR